MPQTWGFPTGSDGISMGTVGMRYSLPSREEIARCIQIGWGSHQMDGLLCIAGCDKNKPGCLMGIAYCNVPSIYVDSGTIKPGRWKGQDLTVVSAFEAVGAYSAGKMSREDFEGIEQHACPGFGVCGAQYTANTMATAAAALGLGLLDSPLMAAEDTEKLDLDGSRCPSSGACDRARPKATRHHQPQLALQCRRRRYGDRRFDQRGATPPRHRQSGGGQVGY